MRRAAARPAYSRYNKKLFNLVFSFPLGGFLPEENIPAGVESGGEYPGYVLRSVPRRQYPAREPIKNR